jgi:tRNA 2-thiouridine synthesizing protein A
MTFVRTRLALDRMQPGQTLLIRLRGEEPRRNVPRTAAEQGYAVLAQQERPDGITLLLLRKA